MSEGDGNILNLNPTKLCSGQRCECSHKPKGLEAKKEDERPVKGFTRITHECYPSKRFTLPKQLGDGSSFEYGRIPTAIKVEAYYWPGRPTRPLLITITTTNSMDGGKTHYTNKDGYSTDGAGGGAWSVVRISQGEDELIKTLDDLNCQYNDAVPIDLKSDTYLVSSDGSDCIRKRNISLVPKPKLDLPVGTEYEVKELSIKPSFTKISRVLYGGKPTTIGTSVSPTHTIRVYSWKRDGKTESDRTPLLVESITRSEYFYSKNNGTREDNTSWISANKPGKTRLGRGELISMLDGARCNVFHTFKVDLSKNKPYINNKCSGQEIQVVPYGEDPIENYTTYKHTYNGGDKKLMITGFLSTNNADQVFSAISYPIRNVAEVVVYLCKEDPLLVYINSNDPSISTKEWHQYDKGNQTWTPVTNKPTLTTSSHDDIIDILDGLKTECGPPSVIIDISQKTDRQGSCTYTDPGDNSRIRQIKVSKQTGTQNGDPPQHYYRYDHFIEKRNGSYFDIKSFQYGDSHTISQIAKEDAATLVSVYYWKHGDNTGKPLLVRVAYREKKSLSSESYKWYENTGDDPTNNTEWKIAEGDEKFARDNIQLKKKLDLLNCRLNNVVVVDASKKTPTDNTYCHDDIKGELDKDHHSKLKVAEESSSTRKPLATYKAYEHTLGTGSEKFHIVGFKNGPTGASSITLRDSYGTPNSPLLNVSKVIFYFCQDKPDTPLLIYYGDGTKHNWFKKSGNTWTTVPDLTISTDPDKHDEILEQLDSIGNKCQPPKVTIKLEEGPGKARYPSTYDSGDTSCAGKGFIEVESKDVSQAPNYKFFTHIVDQNARDYFTVENVMYNNQRIDKIITPIEKVKEFSVYYWEPLKERGNPLLIKIEKEGNDPDWYENQSIDKSNTQWEDISLYKSTLDEPSKLKKKLKFVNCYVNNVTDIDIGKKPSDKYCHDNKDLTIGEQEHSQLIKVEDATDADPYKDGKLGKFAVYQHSLNQEAVLIKNPPPVNFHISELTNNGQPITFNGSPPIPALNVNKFLVYFCDRDETTGKPLLVHFKRSSTNETDKGEWYQRMNDGSKTTWTKVKTGVPNGEDDILSIYSILNNYATSCKDDTLLRILLGTAAGSAGGGATTYGVYEMIRWLFMSPWPRLM